MRFAAIFRVFARLHLWPQAVFAGSYGGSVSSWELNERYRFGYACLMGRRRPVVRNCFARMLRRELDSSAAINVWLALVAWQLEEPRLSELLNRRTAKLYPNTPEAIIAAREADFGVGLETNFHVDTLASAIGAFRLALQEDLILVPVSASYEPLFELWRSQLALHAKGRLLVLAMDRKISASYGNDPGLAVLDLSHYFGFDEAGRVDDYSKRHLWVLRVLVLRELVRRGHKVISLDLDAVLIDSLDDLLASLPEADIIAQKDYSIPVDVARKLGFILCCGFMVFFPTAACKAFLDLYTTQCGIELDDQSALNHLIENGKIHNRSETEKRLTFESCGVRWACPATSLVSRDLDHGSVIRHFNQRGESIEELRARLGIPGNRF